MQFFINARSGVPIYKQLEQQIEKGIIGGILQSGDQLPTVREVALQLTVNPNTVARAYRELEYRGLIESAQGRGTFIAGNLESPKVGEKERLFRQQLEELLTEARHLNLEKKTIKNIFDDTLKQWEKEV
jgi:GntR family transcriptional regulator